jgi:asparagine N-glycosylation enzyme membrane subunit Stt3
MERREIDRRLRGRLRRWSVIGGVSSGVLLVVAVLLLAIGGPSAGTLGMAGLAILVAVVMIDGAVRLPRPAPRVVGETTVVPASRLVGLIVLLMGVMVALLAFALLSEDVADQRRAWIRYVVPVVAAGLVAFGAVAAARPTRLVVSAQGVTTTGLRRRTIPWYSILSIEPADDAVAGSGSTALSLVVRGADTRLDLLTRWTRPTLWVLIAWLEHYRLHPDDRSELAGPVALERLEAVDARLQDSTLRPAWFTGPAAPEPRP